LLLPKKHKTLKVAAIAHGTAEETNATRRSIPSGFLTLLPNVPLVRAVSVSCDPTFPKHPIPLAQLPSLSLQYYINLSIYEINVDAASRAACAVRRTDSEKLTTFTLRHWLKPSRSLVYP
jgi:hypothetical protein